MENQLYKSSHQLKIGKSIKRERKCFKSSHRLKIEKPIKRRDGKSKEKGKYVQRKFEK